MSLPYGLCQVIYWCAGVCYVVHWPWICPAWKTTAWNASWRFRNAPCWTYRLPTTVWSHISAPLTFDTSISLQSVFPLHVNVNTHFSHSGLCVSLDFSVFYWNWQEDELEQQSMVVFVCDLCALFMSGKQKRLLFIFLERSWFCSEQASNYEMKIFERENLFIKGGIFVCRPVVFFYSWN